jgi:hypothetical protein
VLVDELLATLPPLLRGPRLDRLVTALRDGVDYPTSAGPPLTTDAVAFHDVRRRVPIMVDLHY